MGRLGCLLPFLLLLPLAACSTGGVQPTGTPGRTPSLDLRTAASVSTSQPALPPLDLTLDNKDIALAPLPLRAGVPFTITATIHNNSNEAALDVPVLVYVSSAQEESGFTPFVRVLTVTLPAAQSVPLPVPVRWNLNGGKHQVWVQVNRLPQAWQDGFSVRPETDPTDNSALLEVMVEPFDAYTSPLCPGRVDIEIGPADVLPEPDRQRVLVWVHNSGNRAVYHVPVVILGDQLTGIAYSPAIPPCGGTAEVAVEADRPLKQGESVTVQVNPIGWPGGLPEDDWDNNVLAVSVGLMPGMIVPPGTGLEDYDFSISSADIESPEPWIVLVTVRNLGTRDAARVPIRVENAAGKKIIDVIPLVQGKGSGVAALRVGMLWSRGGRLTLTVNPEGAKGAYPESHRDNNVATFDLP